MKNPIEYSPDVLRKVADLKEQIIALQTNIAGLTGESVNHQHKHWTQTAAGRLKLARRMKATWEQRKSDLKKVQSRKK